jgi:hypothetical protein
MPQEVVCHDQHPGRAKSALQAVHFREQLRSRAIFPDFDKPSTVSMCAPFTCTANIRHDRVARPSTMIVQARKSRARIPRGCR